MFDSITQRTQYTNAQKYESSSYTMPNSRTVPTPAPSSSTPFHAISDDAYLTQNGRHQSYRESDASVYSTYNLRESLVDPDANERVVGVSRETYIEPNTSTIVQKHVTPQSIYGAQYLQTAAPSSTSFLSGPSLNFFNDESTESLSIDIPSRPSSQQQEQQPRVQHADSPVRMQQAFVNVPQPSSAIIEQTQNHHQHHPVGNRQHPQPLPPLVIPPTPCSSAPPTHQEQQEQHLQPQQDSAPPHLSPGTPASSRSGGSPHTPSPNTLLPPTSTNDFLRPSSPTGQQPPLSPTVPPTAAYSGGNFTNKLTKKMQKEPEPANEAEALVGQGIKYHEAGQLAKATECFRQAAIKDSPIGMFLYGVSLRHGWGCKRNEHTAFQYLQKAAEHAVMDLNSLSSTVNTSAVKGELIMAIYELGVSFRHGWGCRKNKETAVYFFKIAADLGDPDAQNDLGHCYYHGHGVKKDLYQAAKYYRMADKQGCGIMGNSWIYKPKYDKACK